jgi:hypothetical protein
MEGIAFDLKRFIGMHMREPGLAPHPIAGS